MGMNGKTVVTVGAVVLCIIIGVAAGRCSTTEPLPEKAVLEPVSGVEKQQETSHDPLEDQTPVSEEGKYWLRVVDGRLGVFLDEAENPEMVLDVYLSSLPQADQEALQEGVCAESYRQLLSLIEDYIS